MNEFQPNIAKYDNSALVCSYLDPQLSVRLVEYNHKFTGQKIYAIAISRLLQYTNMKPYIRKLRKEAGLPTDEFEKSDDEETRAMLEERKHEIDGMIQALRMAGESLQEQFGAQDPLKIVSYAVENNMVDANVLDKMFEYARFFYKCGDYDNCFRCLEAFLELANGAEAEFKKKREFAMWGRLAARILSPDGAADLQHQDIIAIDQMLEGQWLSKKEELVQRCWLLHWALFACFNENFTPKPETVDWFMRDINLASAAIAAPHLLRYFAVLLMVHKRIGATHVFSSHPVLSVMEAVKHSYSDCFTLLLESLVVDLDFEAAQRHLVDCAVAAEADHFIFPHKESFQETARLLIFECYCRVHNSVNIDMIAERLYMRSEDAEEWIVNLIRNAKLDARIDSENNRVVMTAHAPNVYGQVLEKTKQSFRTAYLLKK
eukprot:GHVL01042739.1.p1 GENE.GHVL01042739.1~~GHVL01042739.1.p1  ORF type:complete len:453 (+),score=78.72 GHVL01042739.1:65-1360(+)